MLDINKVYQGDCLEVMEDIDDKSIDMILADLPYNTTACKWDKMIPLEPLWEQYKRIIKNNGAIVLTASQPFTSKLVMSNPEMFRYEWIWDKDRSSGALNANRMPLKYHENICVFYFKLPTYNPQMTKGKRMKKGGSTGGGIYGKTEEKRYTSDTYYPRSIQTFKGCHNMTGKVHLTQKPVALFEYLIKTYTDKCDLVLDNVAGSGTTGVACQNLGRNFILIEKEPKYVEICKKRLAKDNQEDLCDQASMPAGYGRAGGRSRV